MSSITIDASQVLAFSERLRAAPEITQRHLTPAVQKAGLLVEGRGKQNAPVKTGHLRRSITTRAHGVGGGAIAIVGTNVPYARWVEEGRGPVGAKRGKALRFELGGRVVYAKRVGPAAGRWYMRKALRSSQGEIRVILRNAIVAAWEEVIG